MTGTRAHAAHMALATAERLLDPAVVITGSSLAGGLAGTALMHARFARADRVFADAAQSHWAMAARQARETADEGQGIFASPAGIAASLILGTPYLPDPDQSAPAAGVAAGWLSRRATRIAAQDQARRRAGHPLSSWAAYDLINGPAGIGRILLAALTSGHTAAEPGLQAMLATLTIMINASADLLGWWMPAAASGRVHLHPSGEAATGVAHGIAGPLAFLALSHASGYTVAQQETAIRTAADWLLRWQTARRWAPAVTGTELASGTPDPMPGRRDAWCYGTPGISRALTMAGQALHDPSLTTSARASLGTLTDRHPRDWDVEGPTICHGYAGVLQATAPADTSITEPAAQQLSDAFDPQYTFAFRHHSNGTQSDSPGFLTGACGIALVLADYGELPSAEVPASWDAVLLLS
jgi:hypothetical protein